MSFPVGATTRLFFDKAAVLSKVPPAERRALSKFGAFVRRRAKSSIKYADGEAPPGQPPHAHLSKGFTKKGSKKRKYRPQPASPLRELIFFSYDPAKKSVVIGPALGGPQTGAPQTLEEGGTVVRRDYRDKPVEVSIRPRPFMLPAFLVELKEVGGDYRNIIK